MSSLSSSKIPSKSSFYYTCRHYQDQNRNLFGVFLHQNSIIYLVVLQNDYQHFDIQPINIDDELIQRQELSILIYELGSHLNMYIYENNQLKI